MKKMKPKLIAIAFSDIHIHKFKLFDKDNSRLQWSLDALTYIANIAQKNNVPLLFAGDLFHTPVSIENETLSKTLAYFKQYIDDRKIHFFAISGNHDMSEKNGIDHNAPSYLESFSTVFNRFYLLDHHDKPWQLPNWDAHIWGIPYMNNDTELRQRVKQLRKVAKKYKGFKILLMHGDCPGAMDAGIELKENKALGDKKNLKTLFAPWDLVLFGHIHAPQKITNKCYMLGSPIHQTSGDTGQMGYWKIFIGKEPEFIGLVDFPKFVRLEKDQVAEDNGIDYIIPYEEIGAIEEVEKGDFNLSNSRTVLAKRYAQKRGIKSKSKRKALIKALNEVE